MTDFNEISRKIKRTIRNGIKEESDKVYNFTYVVNIHYADGSRKELSGIEYTETGYQHLLNAIGVQYERPD